MTGVFHPLAAGFEHHPERADVALLLHGWTGSPSHWRPIADRLVDAGFGVVAPLLAGHGTTPENMIETNWRDWLRSASEGAAEAVEQGSRLHIAGLSMGGLLGLLIANAFDAVSVTTVNSPIVVHNRRIRMSFLRRGSKEIRKDPEDEWPEGFAAEYAVQYDGTPIGTVADLYDLMRATKRHLPMVSAPALVVQSKTDETVRPQSGSYLYEHLGSISKEMVWLERSLHVATLDAERDVITTVLIDHIRRSVRTTT